MRRGAVLALAVVLTLSTAQATEVIFGPSRVIDGDTVIVSGIHVRLKGVDSPELGTAAGVAAKREMIQIVHGRDLACTLTGEKTHGRDVGHCYADGVDIGAEIIRHGRALACSHFMDEPWLVLETEHARATIRRAPYC